MHAVIIFLKMLLSIFAVIIGLLILMMSTPFYYYLAGSIKDSIDGKAAASFLFGFFKIEFLKTVEKPVIKIFLSGICVLARDIRTGVRKDKKRNNRKKKERQKEPFKFPDKRVRREIIIFIKEMLGIVKPRTFKINGIYGFEDPAVTGIICALIPMAREIIPSSEINLYPTFEDEVINIKAEISGEFIWIAAGCKFLRFILKKDIRKIIFRKSKKVETIHQAQVY